MRSVIFWISLILAISAHSQHVSRSAWQVPGDWLNGSGDSLTVAIPRHTFGRQKNLMFAMATTFTLSCEPRFLRLRFSGGTLKGSGAAKLSIIENPIVNWQPVTIVLNISQKNCQTMTFTLRKGSEIEINW